MAGAPKHRDHQGNGGDLREQRQRLLLHLRRGLHDGDRRSDQRGGGEHRQCDRRSGYERVAQQAVEGVHSSTVAARRYPAFTALL